MGEDFADLAVELVDLFGELGEDLGEGAQHVFIGMLFALNLLAGAAGDELFAAADEGFEFELGRAGGNVEARGVVFAEVGDDLRVDAVGFGELAFAFCEIANAAGVDAADGELGVQQGEPEGFFVAAGGLEDEVAASGGAADDFLVTGGGVGD